MDSIQLSWSFSEFTSYLEEKNKTTSLYSLKVSLYSFANMLPIYLSSYVDLENKVHEGISEEELTLINRKSRAYIASLNELIDVVAYDQKKYAILNKNQTPMFYFKLYNQVNDLLWCANESIETIQYGEFRSYLIDKFQEFKIKTESILYASKKNTSS